MFRTQSPECEKLIDLYTQFSDVVRGGYHYGEGVKPEKALDILMAFSEQDMAMNKEKLSSDCILRLYLARKEAFRVAEQYFRFGPS